MNTIRGIDPTEPGEYNQQNIQKNTHGVTVTQVFVVILILGLLAASVYFYLNRKKQTAELEVQQRQLEGTTRDTLTSAADELRNAAILATGNTFITTAESNKLVYRGDANGDGAVDTVTYELVNNELVRTVNSERTVLVTNVRNVEANTPLFTYFQNAGTQLSSPVDTNAIHIVKMFLEIDINLQSPPPPFTVESTVEVKA